jgi:hypothetical protein
MLIPFSKPTRTRSRSSLKPMPCRLGHAVVVGAGAAGQLAARALWKHFDRVTILERGWGAPAALLPNVSVVNGALVTRYAVDWEYARITGVFVRGHGPRMPEDLLYADLVVDAAGRGSQTPRWLEELGYLPPTEVTVGAEGWRRNYERLKRFPVGLLVMGDALCMPDPASGHTIAIAMRGAQMLDLCLSRTKSRGTRGIEEVTRDFRLSVAEVVNSVAPRPGPIRWRAVHRWLRARLARPARWAGLRSACAGD